MENKKAKKCVTRTQTIKKKKNKHAKENGQQRVMRTCRVERGAPSGKTTPPITNTPSLIKNLFNQPDTRPPRKYLPQLHRTIPESSARKKKDDAAQ